MASAIGVTGAYLSAVETGKRSASPGLLRKIAGAHHVTAAEADAMWLAFRSSQPRVTIRLGRTGEKQREAALLFARWFDQMDDETAGRIIAVLQNANRKENPST